MVESESQRTVKISTSKIFEKGKKKKKQALNFKRLQVESHLDKHQKK